jgi:putative colanic acid biosysnthesis UDP-glucose lipid carrier transferase
MPQSLQSIQQHWSPTGFLYRFTDAVCIVLGLYVASRFATWQGTPYYYWLAGAAAIILYGMVAELSGIYRRWRGVSKRRELISALFAWGLTLLLLLAVGYFLQKATGDYSRKMLLIWFFSTPALMIAFRMGIRVIQRTLRALGYNTRHFAVVGVNELGFQLAKNIESLPEMGLKLAGFFDDRGDERNPAIPEKMGERVGDLDELLAQAKDGRVDIIYITFPMRAEGRIRGVLHRLSDTTASVYVVPDFFVFQLLHSRWSDILGLPVVSVFETPFYGIDGVAKRLLDIVGSAVFLLLLAVPMALIAIAIKLSSPGPVFFRQRRYGLDGREIRVWKFRTMTVCEDGPAVVQAVKNDARVTRVGAILRKTSLDELPQLFNVLAGSMSLVGPRPHANALNEEFRTRVDGYMLRHKVKPGITGLAQVNGWRGETDTREKMEKRIEFDLHYIREWSLWMDIKVLLQTPLEVILGRNAY